MTTHLTQVTCTRSHNPFVDHWKERMNTISDQKNTEHMQTCRDCGRFKNLYPDGVQFANEWFVKYNHPFYDVMLMEAFVAHVAFADRAGVYEGWQVKTPFKEHRYNFDESKQCFVYDLYAIVNNILEYFIMADSTQTHDMQLLYILAIGASQSPLLHQMLLDVYVYETSYYGGIGVSLFSILLWQDFTEGYTLLWTKGLYHPSDIGLALWVTEDIQDTEERPPHVVGAIRHCICNIGIRSDHLYFDSIMKAIYIYSFVAAEPHCFMVGYAYYQPHWNLTLNDLLSFSFTAKAIQDKKAFDFCSIYEINDCGEEFLSFCRHRHRDIMIPLLTKIQQQQEKQVQQTMS